MEGEVKEDLETLATKRVRARLSFVVHALIYIAFNGGFFVIWLLTGRGYPWFVWPMLIWGIGMLGHAVSLMIGPGSAAERAAIDREVHRLREASR